MDTSINKKEEELKVEKAAQVLSDLLVFAIDEAQKEKSVKPFSDEIIS